MTQKRISFEDQAGLIRWAGARVGVPDWPSDAFAIGVLRPDGAPMAVGLLTHFHDQGAWAHFAAEPGAAWADRESLGAIFWAAFIKLERKRISARVPQWNRRSQKLVLSMGFRPEGVEREAMDGEDVILFGMLARECRWIKGA